MSGSSGYSNTDPHIHTDSDPNADGDSYTGYHSDSDYYSHAHGNGRAARRVSLFAYYPGYAIRAYLMILCL